MHINELKSVARLVDLHPPDVPERPTLVIGDGYVSYEGMYAGAHTTCSLMPGRAVGVDGETLKGVVSMLGKEEEVKVTFTDTHMLVRGSTTSRLKLRTTEGWQRREPPNPDYPSIIMASPSPLVQVLAHMKVVTREAARISDSYALRGVKLVVRKNRLVLRATDSRNAVMAMLDIEGCSYPDDFGPIAPTEELAVAVSMMQERDFVIENYGGHLVVDDGTTMVRMAVLAGEIPPFTALANQPHPMPPVTLTRAQIIAAEKMRTIMDSTSGVRLRCKDGTVKLFIDGEAGEAVIECGVQEVEDFEARLSAASLRYSLRIQDPVQLYMSDPHVPFAVHEGDLWYWAAPVVV